MRFIFRRLFYLICIFACSVSVGYAQTLDYIFSDGDLFGALNLDFPGLEKVKIYVLSGDYKNAKNEYVSYLKNRVSPKWYFDWRDYSPPLKEYNKSIVKYADRHANNELLAHGTWYQYGDTIDWLSDHSYDNYSEWLWQLNRHYCWVNLADAYWAIGDEKYAKAFVKQMNSWIDQCKVPGKQWGGVGSVWRTLDAGLRMQKNWFDAFFRFLPSPNFDDESIVKMVKSFYNHAIHLRNHSTAYNWLTMEMNGLFNIGLIFPEFKDSKDWRSFAVNKLYEEEVKMFYPDGPQLELSPGYHAVSTSSIASVYRLAKLNDYQLPENFVKRLESAYEVFIKLMMPDGSLPGVNDSEWISSLDYINEAVGLFPNRKDFRYFSTHGKEGEKPTYTSIWMPWAGWYVMRSGWSENAYYSFFEVGPFGAGHQHEDKLSFILYAYGKRLITECGIYSYDNSEYRKYSLSALGHNVTRVDGKDQNRRALKEKDEIKFNVQPQTNKWESNRKYDFGEGRYSEGFGIDLDKCVTHHRSLKFIKNKFWVVTDTYTPSDGSSHFYDTWFHFSTPYYGIKEEMGVVYSNEPESPNIAIVHLGSNTDISIELGQEKPEIQGWLPEAGGGNGYHCVPVATPVFHFSGEGVIKQTYLFVPFESNSAMPIMRIKHVSKKKLRVYLNNGKDIPLELTNIKYLRIDKVSKYECI